MKSNNQYFSENTENAIIAYNKSEDPAFRSKIYREQIHQPFFKLTQNIIHTFKYYYTEVVNIEDLQHEVITFLLSKIHLYNHRKNIHDRFRKIIVKDYKEEYDLNFEEYVGDVDKVTQTQINDFIKLLNVSDECREKLSRITPPKAYSYFGTITKRYLIINNENNYKKKIDNINIDEYDDETSDFSFTKKTSPALEYDIDISESKSTRVDKLSTFIDSFVEHCYENLETLFPKKNDAITADAILELFKKRENIDIFNKKAIYIYLREMVNVDTTQITKISNKLYKIFRENYTYYLENDIIKFS
jgi:hypothetical protein